VYAANAPKRAVAPNTYFVYILASKKNGTLYVGVTKSLLRRAWQHKQKNVDSFTARYNVTRLVYF
jgi:putative endonuclease